MKEIKVSIELLGYWHAGSGAGRGGDADSLVVRDACGIAYLPGRTVKGLFREGVQLCEDFNAVPVKTTDRLFGKPAAPGDEAGSTPGQLLFQDALLNGNIRNWLAASDNQDNREALFSTISSTALDDQGQAKEKTLRMIEVVLPAVLETSISGPDDGKWVAAITPAARLIRSLGSHRHRGLGRCRVSILETEEGKQ